MQIMLKVSYDCKRQMSYDMYLLSRRWQVWKVTDGMTTTLRTHLEDKHAELYPELRERLTRFIAADDQVHVHLLPLLPLTPIDDTSQSMLLSAKSFENCSRMLGLVILKTGIYHIGQRQLNLSLRSTKSVTESRKSE